MFLRYVLKAFVFAVVLLTSMAATGQSFDELLKAVTEGNTKVVQGFLSRGLDPNTTDAAGNTLLMNSARFGHMELVSLLIERKASVTRRSPHGDTALMHASLGGHLAIAKLLVAKGAEVHHAGWAPVHYAAFEGRSEIVRFLLEKGADKNALAPNGYSPLMLAAMGGHLEAVRALLYEDADVGVKGPKGETALAIAKAGKNFELANLLTRAGAVE